MTFQLDPNNFRCVEAVRSLADMYGGKVGSLVLQIKVIDTDANYQVVHNGILKYEGKSSYDAACKFNDVINLCEKG